MRTSWSIIYLTKDYEAFRGFSLKSVGEPQEIGVWAERVGIGSVFKLAMAKQVYKNRSSQDLTR